MVAACDPRGPQAARAARQYTALHEGTEPARVACATYDVPAGRLAWLGKVTDVQYAKRVREGGRVHAPAYHHPFARHAQPDLYRDSRGKLFVRGRRYYTTSHGVEDWDRATAKEISARPARLVALGKLEWIRYNDGTRSRDLRFDGPGQPELAHDELGKLHLLMPKSRYEQGDPVMAKRRRHTKSNPSHRRHGRRRNARYNPSGAASGGETMHIVASTAAAVGVGAVTILGLSYVPGLDKLSPVWRGLAEIGGATAAGLAMHAAGLPSAVYGGVMIGGGLKGADELLTAGVAKARAMMTPATHAAAPPAPPGQLPPAQNPPVQPPAQNPAGYLRSNLRARRVA